METEHRGRFAESFPAPRKAQCERCPDEIQIGESVVEEPQHIHRGAGRRGWAHDECVD